MGPNNSSSDTPGKLAIALPKTRPLFAAGGAVIMEKVGAGGGVLPAPSDGFSSAANSNVIPTADKTEKKVSQVGFPFSESEWYNVSRCTPASFATVAIFLA